MVVTGEVGTGKTTILRWMMQRLDHSFSRLHLQPATVGSGVLSTCGYASRCSEVGNKIDLLLELGRALESRHSRGAPVLIIDEAQGIVSTRTGGDPLLSNFESDTAKQPKSYSPGSPNCEKFNDPDLRQLKQR